MLVAYIAFNGNTREAFDFYAEALDAKITRVATFGEAPNADQMAEADKNKVMHIALEGPHGVRLMGNDHVDFMGDTYKPGNNFSLSLHPASKELAEKCFAGLSEGGNVIVPLSPAPWGGLFGMFFDKFGVKWMINQE